MINKEHLEDSFASLSKALVKLKDAIDTPVDSQRFVIDATIQRFEFTNYIVTFFQRLVTYNS